MSVLLSICIPTFNRADYLKESVEAIIEQLSPDLQAIVEICISNNASTDGTHDLVQNLIHSNPTIAISYRRNETNMGPDWNFFQAMSMARGEFSWLFGDDDGLVRNAIPRILELVKENKQVGLFLFNRINCDINLRELSNQDFLRPDIGTTCFDFSDPIQEKYYYTMCRSLGGLLSFISSVVYKTEAVKNQEFDETFIGSAYSFLFFWYKFLKRGNKLFYVREYLIKCRHGLPSFGSGYRRTMLDFKGFLFIKDKLFVNDSAGQDFIEVLKYEWPIEDLLTIYCKIDLNEWNMEVKPRLKIVGWTDREISFIEKMGNAPGLYKSRLKERLKAVLKRG
ncbi:glycosyltransferase family 2 protein [Filimonas effusa]|uniref:Glycosyltransferase family 2 protein n=1 Tax=Filimonas effusa TaxID=2508721 RepID=A0A4Q1DCZ8_9BACT|nr:glycosyltransferase family 2 protein [Filimonas effusa]RXK87352.1 glycosyltransferase family 2 protein [Filimonas effusa]